MTGPDGNEQLTFKAGCAVGAIYNVVADLDALSSGEFPHAGRLRARRRRCRPGFGYGQRSTAVDGLVRVGMACLRRAPCSPRSTAWSCRRIWPPRRAHPRAKFGALRLDGLDGLDQAAQSVAVDKLHHASHLPRQTGGFRWCGLCCSGSICALLNGWPHLIG
jgi:hypothetical protein